MVVRTCQGGVRLSDYGQEERKAPEMIFPVRTGP